MPEPFSTNIFHHQSCKMNFLSPAIPANATLEKEEMNNSKQDSTKLDKCVSELFTTLTGRMPNTRLAFNTTAHLVGQAVGAAGVEREQRIDAVANFFDGFLNQTVDRNKIQSVFDKHFKI